MSKKEDLVLYNPKKGYEFTKKLIAFSPNINWVPLTGMTRSELIDIVKRAKVYIDFGYHPGKDRLPRECAMNGCCIITGYKGSAAFYEDVMIPCDYKFKDSRKSIPSIIKRINWTLSNYDTAINDFEEYRKTIRNEESEFHREVSRLFGYEI